MRQEWRIKQEGEHVLLIRNGVLVAEMPWEAAAGFARAVTGAARLAEEFAKHDQVIGDQALAFRAGLPWGLTDNKAIIEEAKKECLHNRDLRRFIKGTPTRIKIGTPGVFNES